MDAVAPIVPDEEAAAFAARFSELHRVSDTCWKGRLPIHAIFNGVEVRDEFDIEISVPDQYPDDIPALSGIVDRVGEICDRRGISDLRTVHFNTANGCACLCVKQEEALHFPTGSTLIIFVEKLVVPYLYGLSFFDKHGRWPWPEYSHGVFGLLEFAYRQRPVNETQILDTVEQLRKFGCTAELWKLLHRPSRNRECLCGSGKIFRKCHAEAWQGVVQLNRAAKNLGLESKELFATRALEGASQPSH